MRIFALSDIHVDYPENLAWIEDLSAVEYKDDALLLAGDVSHDPGKLESALSSLGSKFHTVFFVPGNHDLWLIHPRGRNSVGKFHEVLELCASLGIKTAPERIAQKIWVVPLFSWYVQPEEGEGSLYLPKPGEDPSLDSWSDTHLIHWPSFAGGQTPADYFLRLNENHVNRRYDAPVVSLSHFLPRRDLILSTPEEDKAAGGPIADLNRSFNFSRVAGTRKLDDQVRSCGSSLHVYGHQHRNRCRRIDGVLYVSHCLGYARERRAGHIRHLGSGPRQIWSEETAAL